MIGNRMRLLGVGLVCLMAAALMGVNIPFLVNYQGRVNNAAGLPISGPVTMDFTIYDAPTDGSPLWSETQNVTLNTGLYNVLLGSMNPLSPQVFDNANVFLEVSVDGQTLSPRQQIVSVPFAMRAGLAGIDPTDPATMLAVEQAYNNAQANHDLDGDLWDRDPWSTDCDDANAEVYPGAPELCDGIDNQCPGDPGYGQVDEGCTSGPILVNTAADTLNYAGGGIGALGATVSLRDAILVCNDSPLHQLIRFHPSLAGSSIAVDSKLPNISDGVTIDGDINGDGAYNPADDATLGLSSLSGSAALMVMASNVTLQYLGFTGYNLAPNMTALLAITTPPGLTVSNILVQSSEFSGTAGAAVMVSGTLGGITAGNLSNVTLQYLTISGGGQSAVMITGGPSSGNNVSNINVFNSNITSGTFSSGVFVDGGFGGGDNNSVLNVNVVATAVQNLAGAGIEIFGGSSSGGGNRVSVNMRSNTLTNNLSGLDIRLGVDSSLGNSVDVSAVSTQLENNSSYGAYATRESDSTGTINVDLGGNGLSGGLNTLSGNGLYGFYNDTLDDMYAQNNYWGDASGPSDGDTFDLDGIPDPTGSGDLISGFIYYDPYTQGQWVAQTAPDLGSATMAGMVEDICAPASNEVYAAAGRFVLDYQGSSWAADEPVVSPGRYFRSISAPASGSAWAVAAADDYDKGSGVYRLSGGVWTRETLPSVSGNMAMLGVHMTSATQGWLVGWLGSGDNRGIVMSYDGTSWTEQPVPALGGNWWDLEAVHALDASHALAVGQMEDAGSSWGVVLYWDGSVWSSQVTPVISGSWQLNEVVSVQAGTTVKSWVVGRDDQNGTGVMLYSENYSGSWSVVSLPARSAGYELDGIDMSSPTLGFAAGVEFYGNTVDGILLRYDGSNWTDEPVSLASSFWGLFSVDVVSPTEAWAGGIDIIGKQSVILYWNGSAWTPQAMPSAEQWYGLKAVDFPSAGTGWAVGENYDLQSGAILQYSAGTWSAVASPIPDMMWSLADVSFPTTAKGWAVGGTNLMDRAGLVLAYDSGTWTRDTSLPDLGSADWSLAAVSFPTDTQGWAVGEAEGNSTSGLVLEYNSGTWSVDTLPSIGNSWYLADVSFDSASDGWAVGFDYFNNKGIVLHYTGGAWADATPGGSMTNNLDLASVFFLDANHGWVGAQSWSGGCSVLSYDTGVWSPAALNPGGPASACRPEDVTALAADRVWLAGWKKMPNNNEFRYPRAWYYNGSYWGVAQNFGLAGSNSLSGIDMLTESDGWAVGLQFDSTIPNAKGLIEHYQ